MRDSEARLRHSEQRLRQFADALPQLAWMANSDGIVTYYNSQMTYYGGYELIAAGQWRWQPIVHPDDLPATMEAWEQAVAHGTLYECQHRMRMADGSYRWHLSRAHCDDAQQWFGTATDIHELRETQERLSQRERELSEANQRKDDFLAMLGHELRNPLAAISNATALLKLLAPDNARVQQAQAVLERQSAHMTGLIDGLLEVSRIARGKIRLERETVDLREILQALIRDRSAELEAHGLELHEDLPPEPLWVHGDRIRLAQVFDNLLGNAIKFTTGPGRISVTAGQQSGEAVIRVRDTGVGIAPQMLERVFEPFLQEVQEIDRGGGLGLGLALAKALVELHGGAIQAHSAGRGAGAEFEVRLPLSSTLPVATPQEPRSAVNARRTILLVEDNLDAGQTLRALLEILGHDVTVAQTGARALDALRARAADIVLCDLGLPGMSGYEVVRAIRGDAALRQIPVVALTGYGQPQDRRRTAEAGFDDHLTKPVDVAELEAVIARLIS